jgi:hypothetical protein
MNKTLARIVGPTVGLSLLSMLIIGSFLGALHHPAPHRLPVAVAGPPSAAGQLSTAFARHAPGAFAFTQYPDPAAARQAVLDRAVGAAVLLAPRQQSLLVASAKAATAAFQAETTATGQHLAVTDIRPLTPADPNGISPLFVFIGLALPSAAFGVTLAGPAGRRLNFAARLAALAGFAVLAGSAAAWVADGMIGALIGAPVALAAVGALTAFAVSATAAAARHVAGIGLAVLAVLLIVPIGVPAAGGPFGPVFVASWYARLGVGLPAGATMPAIRDVVYFNGNALSGPLLVLALWAFVAAVVLALPPVARRGITVGADRRSAVVSPPLVP